MVMLPRPLWGRLIITEDGGAETGKNSIREREREMVNPAETAGRRPGEKASNFSMTCSLLSQYLREKVAFGDLGLGISAPAAAAPLAEGRARPETPRTMDLLPGVETVGGEDVPPPDQDAGSHREKFPDLSLELFPRRAAFGTSGEKKPEISREPPGAQMTIFYGGKVVVFDNLPADKARELMAMAGRCRPGPAQHNPAAAAAPAPTSEAKTAAAAPTPAVAAAQEAPPQKPSQPAASGADMPIARRVSLHRFLEKRKDRRSSRAPYPVNGSLAEASAANLEKQQWLGLAPQVSKPADLHG